MTTPEAPEPSPIDLAAFARPSTPARPSARPPRRLPWRFLAPAALILAFAALFVGDFVELLAPKVEVTLVRPELARGERAARRIPGGLAVQAAGWIEPDPFPLGIAALRGGVVRGLTIREGDRVEAGQIVASLEDREWALAAQLARAETAAAEAAAQTACETAELADLRFHEGLETTFALASAKARVRARTAAVTRARHAAQSADAELRVAAGEVALQMELSKLGGAGVWPLAIAEAAKARTLAHVESLRAAIDVAEAEVVEAQAEQHRAEAEFGLRIEDRAVRDRAHADVALAEAELVIAKVKESQAQLAFSQALVRAPSAGVVLDVLAGAGSSLAPGDPVARTFDPLELRARVDVPQADVHKLRVGQRAEVLSEARAGAPYAARVQRIVQRADIQKVTLAVHVRIEDPDDRLKPDMLVQVRFYADDTTEGGVSAPTDAAVASATLLVPERVLDDNGVWVLSADGQRAQRRAVERGATVEGMVEIHSGLGLSDKVIDRGARAVREGAKVRVTADSAGGAR